MAFLSNRKPSSSVHPAILSLMESQIAMLRLGEWHQPLIHRFTSSSDQCEKPRCSNLTEVWPKDPAERTHAGTHRPQQGGDTLNVNVHTNTHKHYETAFSQTAHTFPCWRWSYWVLQVELLLLLAAVLGKTQDVFGNTHQSSFLTDDSDCYCWNVNWEQTHITKNISSQPLCLFSPVTQKTPLDYNRRRSIKRQKYKDTRKPCERQTEGCFQAECIENFSGSEWRQANNKKWHPPELNMLQLWQNICAQRLLSESWTQRQGEPGDNLVENNRKVWSFCFEIRLNLSCSLHTTRHTPWYASTIANYPLSNGHLHWQFVANMEGLHKSRDNVL